MACVALTCLMRTLELEFLQPNPRLILNDDKQLIIHSLCKKLSFLQTFVEESEKKAHNSDEELNDLIARIRGVALEAEYGIEAELVEDDDPMIKKFRLALDAVSDIEAELVEDDDPMMTKFRLALEAESDIEAELVEIPHQMLDVTLRRVLKDVEHLIAMIEARTAKGLQTQHPEESSLSSAGQSSSQLHASKFEEDTMVGQAKEFKELKEKLLSSNKPLQVMSLVGMGGIGKTTFARKLANDSEVKKRFHCCGWATMSQEHNKRQVLLQLCRSVMPMRDDIKTMDDGEIAAQVQNSLKGRRYLIILDDIWTVRAWEDVKRCFPDEDRGSRILLTTRLKEVSECASSHNLHDMRLLSFEESWDLFCQKFETLNKEFKTIGKKIVKKCRGLPLTIVVVAGHLFTNMAVDEWKSVESTLNSLVNLDMSQQISRILSLSYKNLPCHLKSCFLYLGAFPEDSEIRIKKVIRLWIAEGLIKEESQNQKTLEDLSKKKKKTLEEVGEGYLQDLMSRSLIMKSERSSSNGEVETCKMHDLLHELCASKAKTEKLLCTRDSTDYFIKSDGNRWLSLKLASQGSLCLAALKKSRSILCFDMRKWNDPQWDASNWDLNSQAKNCQMTANSFKMLRVLDLTLLDYTGTIPSDIKDVVLLRYLALASHSLLTSIPLWKNRNLQTLIICEDINGFRQLPRGIWELPQLRHLQLYHQLIPMYTPQVAQLNLQTMYWLQCVECTKQVLSRIPNVKELGIIAQGCISHHCLDDLKCLNKLEKLKVQGTYCPIKLLRPCTFPENLKEITFAKTLIPWEAMNVMSMLPNLEVLKLKNHACVGQDWELTVEKGFPNLKFLLISVTDLKHWELGDDVDDDDHPFPNLERLVLRNCFELKEMPSWIENLKNLKSVQLEHCHASLVTSAREIKERQLEYYQEEFALEILVFPTQSDEDQHSTLTQVSLPLCHSFAEENDEDIKTSSVFLEARSLDIPHSDNPGYWRWIRDSGHEVAVLKHVCWLEIKTKLDTRRLHKNTSYSAYLIFKLKPESRRLDIAFTYVRYIKDKRSFSENQRCQVFLAERKSSEHSGRFSNRRHDGWMEIKLGDFYISSTNEGEVEMRLWNTHGNAKSGLNVKGIEVRPSN